MLRSSAMNDKDLIAYLEVQIQHFNFLCEQGNIDDSIQDKNIAQFIELVFELQAVEDRLLVKPTLVRQGVQQD